MKLPGTVGSLIPWWALFIAALMILGLLISMTGCATGGYWVKMREPILVRGIVEVDRPCGRADYDGCPRYATGMIEIKRGLAEPRRSCVVRHEMKHLAGYDHDPRGGFATDCGDGEMVPG